VFADCAIGRSFKRALFRGGLFAAAAGGGVITTNVANNFLSPHVNSATKISAFYVAHKIVLASSLVPSYCKTTRL
jgi:hypothetical protein